VSNNSYMLEQAEVFRVNQMLREAEHERQVKEARQAKAKSNLKNALGKWLVSLGYKLANEPQRV
jgi:hypothetical protein